MSNYDLYKKKCTGYIGNIVLKAVLGEDVKKNTNKVISYDSSKQLFTVANSKEIPFAKFFDDDITQDKRILFTASADPLSLFGSRQLDTKACLQALQVPGAYLFLPPILCYPFPSVKGFYTTSNSYYIDLFKSISFNDAVEKAYYINLLLFSVLYIDHLWHRMVRGWWIKEDFTLSHVYNFAKWKKINALSVMKEMLVLQNHTQLVNTGVICPYDATQMKAICYAVEEDTKHLNRKQKAKQVLDSYGDVIEYISFPSSPDFGKNIYERIKAIL